MALLRNLLCKLFGHCDVNYNKNEDPIVIRYLELDHRVDRLWKPRDILDIR